MSSYQVSCPSIHLIGNGTKWHSLCSFSLFYLSLVAQLVKNPPVMQETLVQFLSQEDPWRRNRVPTPVFLGFPGGSDDKKSACSAGGLGSIPGLGRFPGGGHGNPLQYFSLENPHGPRSLAGSMGSQESDMTKHIIACYDCPLFPSVDTQK